jgi:hypothetical protein
MIPMKTAARFTLADVSRATRAAKQEGAEAVDILPDGTIRVIIKAAANNESPPDAEPKHRDFKL